VALSRELIWVQKLLKALLERIGSLFPVRYLVLDGQFGNRPAMQMAREVGLHLISKLRCDAALYYPYTGEYAWRGAPRKDGARINYQQLPEEYLVVAELDGHLETRTYQLQALHPNFPQPLNVVIITRLNLHSGQFGDAILFSSDLELSHEHMNDYYSLRFQIEFNFWDAKQHWGMEDVMNIKAVPLTNVLNLSLFMVNVSKVLLPEFRQVYPKNGVLDLKAYFRAARYFEELLKFLPQRAEAIFNPHRPGNFLPLGCIHTKKVQVNSP
jgi:putative transposase